MNASSKKVNFVIIGLGYWGEKIINSLSKIRNAKILAVSDIDKERLRYIKKTYNYIDYFYEDFQKALVIKDLDAAIISTPPKTHFEIAKKCISAGIHTLVEKPLSLNSRDAEILISMAMRRNIILMVGHIYSFNPAIKAIKNWISEQNIKISYIESRRLNWGKFQECNVIWDLLPHDISIMRELLNDEPIAVKAYALSHFKTNVPDIAYINMIYPNNVKVNIAISWIHQFKERKLTLLGSPGYITYDEVNSRSEIFVNNLKNVPEKEGVAGIPDISFSTINVGNSYNEPLLLEHQHFIECIHMNKVPFTDGNDGLKTIKIIECVEQSLSNYGNFVFCKSKNNARIFC